MRWTLIIAAATPLMLASPAMAQTDPPAMQMPGPTSPPQTHAPNAAEDEGEPDHAQMDHGPMDHGAVDPDAMDADATDAGAMDHSQMDHSQMDHGAAAEAVGDEPAPAAPSDYAAERFYSAEEMAAARRQLRREHGGAIVSNLMADIAEFQLGDDETRFHWEGEGWIGGDINRFVLKTEGEAGEDDVESAEVQALYSRAIGPYFDLQAGVRYDIEPSPHRAYAVLGFEGVAPYWFETTGALFVSDQGEVSARLEGSYDARLTQRLILQPRAEINVSADDVAERAMGSGLTDVELGLRLRYDITRNVSPYIGVSYETKLGDTADYARAAGEDESDARFVAGVRARF
ncbi:MAG: copper resistance protein B [Hyphomonadaceae bacterium]|nr:copper resistance protein B [Hyphomonadaceae bacterium]